MSYFSKHNKLNVAKIGIWGPPGAGKSAYIAGLFFAERYGWKIRPQTAEATKFINLGVKQLREKLEFIPPTPVGEPLYFPFEFEGESGLLGSKQSFTVVLPECAGELYQNPTEDSELVTEFYNSNGILWLIDPLRVTSPAAQSNDKSYRQMLHEWLDMLYRRHTKGKLPHYMALCFTKMDLPQFSPHLNDTQYCLELLGEDIAILLDDYCFRNNVRFFTTSVAGIDPHTKESNADLKDALRLRRAPVPINLIDPLLWLFKAIRS